MFIYVSKSDFSSGPDGGSPKDGLDVMEFDPATGAFGGIIETIRGLRNPGYLALHPKLPVIYLTERWISEDKSPTTHEQQQRGDCVRTFSIDKQTGRLKEIDRRFPGGLSTMHQSVHPSGKFIAFASPGRPVDPNPKDGHLTVLRIGPDGIPGELCASVVYPDPPPVWRKNRPKPYPHSVFPDPKWKRVFSPCLMADRVLIFRFDENTGGLTPSEQPYAQTSSGSGPRHMAFHPNGRFSTPRMSSMPRYRHFITTAKPDSLRSFRQLRSTRPDSTAPRTDRIFWCTRTAARCMPRTARTSAFQYSRSIRPPAN